MRTLAVLLILCAGAVAGPTSRYVAMRADGSFAVPILNAEKLHLYQTEEWVLLAPLADGVTPKAPKLDPEAPGGWREKTAAELAAEAAATLAVEQAARKARLLPITGPILAAWQRLGIAEVPTDFDSAIQAAKAKADACETLAAYKIVNGACSELITRRVQLAEAGGTWADVLEAAQP